MNKLMSALGALAVAGCAAMAIGAETITYVYDARGRLIRVGSNVVGNNVVTTNYAYDRADNRILRNVTGAPK